MSMAISKHIGSTFSDIADHTQMPAAFEFGGRLHGRWLPMSHGTAYLLILLKVWQLSNLGRAPFGFRYEIKTHLSNRAF